MAKNPKRFYEADFLTKATELGYEAETARQAWQMAIQAVNQVDRSPSADSGEYVTRGSLAELLKSDFEQTSQEVQRLIEQVRKGLFNLVTREELYRFSENAGVPKNDARFAWGIFTRRVLPTLPLEAFTDHEVEIQHLRTFCELMKDRRNWPPNYEYYHDDLLRDWFASFTE